MPTPCEPTGRFRWDGPWEYHDAAPAGVVSSDAPGGGSVAMSALHVWRRPYSLEYACCEDARVVVWVSGNWAVHIVEQHDVAMPVLQAPLLDHFLGLLFGDDPPASDWATADVRRAVEGGRPGGPGEDEEGNGTPELAGVPEADCGERVYLPDGTALPWAELSPPGPAPTPDDGTREVPPAWAPADDLPDCCDGMSRLERRPRIDVLGEPSFTREGQWFVSCHLRVHHPCGLDPASRRVEYWLEYAPGTDPHGDPLPPSRLDLTDLSPPLYSTRETGGSPPSGDGTGRFDVVWDRAPAPAPADSTRTFGMRIRVRSLCGETLEWVYRLEGTIRGRRAPGCLPLSRWLGRR